MSLQRFFLEVKYKGTNYSGFQAQDNANTIQAEIEKAFFILQRKEIILTGSSRTDTNVHAIQNFFHFDVEESLHQQFLYKMNAILPRDIVLKNVYAVKKEAHCRFDAISRTYQYYIYHKKDPFLEDRAYFYPYTINLDLMKEAASVIKEYHDFTSFSKRNTQVKTYLCNIIESEWKKENDLLVYRVSSNRFLRGMVRGLTGTMLQIGRGKLSIEDFRKIIESKDCSLADFAVPGHGLFLIEVNYPAGTLDNPIAAT
jgi:tRNA pseudouridine38-40 synthase